MPRELLFKIRLFGKEEALILLLCLHFPTADRFSHSSFCFPTANIAKKKPSRLEFGLAKTIMILLTEAQPETKKCFIKILQFIFGFFANYFLDNLIAASVNLPG